MFIGVKQWRDMLLAAGNTLIENADELNRLDAHIGDGDHGITMTKIAEQMIRCANINYKNPWELFDALSAAILSTPGGSACTLYGTFFGGFCTQEAKAEGDSYSMKAMFIGGFEELAAISGAGTGGKTMMDALIPAIETLKSKAASPGVMLRDAAASAKDGAKATEGFVARYGRAKNYKERTLGWADPGAVSMSMIFEGFAQALESSKDHKT